MVTLIRLLDKLISIPSPYPYEGDLEQYVSHFFKQNAFSVKTQHVEGNRNNIIVEKGSGKKVVTLYSHFDTVGTVDGWNTNPLKPTTNGDTVFGLGAYDMKGGMAVNMMTFLMVKPENIRLRLLYCVDEEHISKGGYTYAGSKFMDDTDCVLSPEPAFLYGVNGIVTGRIGRAVIQITLFQSAMHFYHYQPQNDISIASSRVIINLRKVYSKTRNKKEFVFVRELSAQSIGMSTPQKISIELDASVVSPHTNTDILTAVKQIVKQTLSGYSGIKYHVEFKKRETPFLTGYEIAKRNHYLEYMKQSIKQITRKKAITYFRSSVADENIFGAAGKTVLGVGPVGGNAHSANEWVSLSSLTNLYKIYVNFIKRVDNENAH